jgi:F-type H+-transporting ATPase subunit epsilon
MIGGLKLEITTPTGQVYSKEVDMVTLPGQEGEMGILPMHVPLIAVLGEGEIVARRGNEEDRLLVTGGCAEITAERVAILTVFATDENAIDETKAEEARARAEARLKEKISPDEVALVQASLSHSLAQLRIKRHQPHRH